VIVVAYTGVVLAVTFLTWAVYLAEWPNPSRYSTRAGIYRHPTLIGFGLIGVGGSVAFLGVWGLLNSFVGGAQVVALAELVILARHAGGATPPRPDSWKVRNEDSRV
jgi:hypothetical protein